MAQSGVGKIRLFDDFCGPEFAVLNAVAIGTSAGGCNIAIGPFKITGDGLDDTYAGVASIDDVVSGAVRLTTKAEDLHSTYIGTATCFNVALMGTLILEARVQMDALTARNVYIGFTSDNDDQQQICCEAGGATTITLTEDDLCGFLYNDEFTTDVDWHYIYKGGATTGETVSTSVDSGVTPVAAEWDVLRVEVDNNGTARWFINGDLKKTLAGAMAVGTEYVAAVVGASANAATVASVDVDYLLVGANRDWTR